MPDRHPGLIYLQDAGFGFVVASGPAEVDEDEEFSPTERSCERDAILTSAPNLA
jgi:hypothetical protein